MGSLSLSLSLSLSFPPPSNTHHSSIASTMRTAKDPADFLHNPLRYKPSFSLTKSTLAQFTPNNSVIFLGTHKISFSPEVAKELHYSSNGSPPRRVKTSGGVQFPFPELNRIEPIYCTPFHHERIPAELLTFWDVVADDRIQLPAKNQFFPTNFTIYPKTRNDSRVPKRLENSDNNAVSMWWLLDTEDFHEPRVNVMCQLNNTNASISAAWEGKIPLLSILQLL